MDHQKIGKSSKNKGKRGELELVHILNDNGLIARRGDCFRGESDIVGLEGIHPEVKRVEKLNIQTAMAQAILEAARKNDGKPTVFHRRNQGKWMVTMMLDDWLDLYGSWKEWD